MTIQVATRAVALDGSYGGLQLGDVDSHDSPSTGHLRERRAQLAVAEAAGLGEGRAGHQRQVEHVEVD